MLTEQNQYILFAFQQLFTCWILNSHVCTFNNLFRTDNFKHTIICIIPNLHVYAPLFVQLNATEKNRQIQTVSGDLIV